MRIGRTLAPAAPPTDWGALWNGVAGILSTHDTIPDLEEQIRRHFAIDHVRFVSSGTAALVVILKALKATSSKTDVIIPAYTCFSVPAAVIEAGLRPVPCDIDPATFDFDPVLLKRALGLRTLAVVAHDLFGVPADVETIHALCRSRGVVVIEDACRGIDVDGSVAATRASFAALGIRSNSAKLA